MSFANRESLIMKHYCVAMVTIAAAAGACLACNGADEALAELRKMEQQCESGDQDKAREIMLAAAEKNETFRKAYVFATSGLVDKAYVKPCGPVLQQLKGRLED
jgi:hypothetical protein